MASGKGRGELEEEIHVSSGGVQTDDDCETRRPLLTRPPAHAECYSVSAAILPFFFPAPWEAFFMATTSGRHRAQPYHSSQRHSVVQLGTIYHLCRLALWSAVHSMVLIGSALAFTIADSLGRHKELILASISYLIGALLTAAAPNLPIMVVGRFLYGIGIGLLIMTGVAVLVVDRLGRRPILIGGVSGIAVSLFLLSSYYTLLKDVSYVAVIALVLYVGCYQLSFGPIGWLMISEVFPLKLRGRGLSIAVLVNFASNALVTFALSPLEDLIGTGLLFSGFGVIAVASLVFIFFIVPETKGLTLEEIEASL